MTGQDHIFLSYSRNDLEAAVNLHSQLEHAGLTVFRDEKNIAWSESWLNELQDKVQTCSGFVLLVGHDGVQRWVGAETEVALIRHINPHDPEHRLPIFPILLDGATHEALPPFLWSCQAIPWDGRATLDAHHLDRIHARDDLAKDRSLPPDVCPFVGLDAFGPDQARLFFGRQEETLKVLACFDRRPGRTAVRWVEINGNSGSGKSSLMNAGVLPLIDKGWLWRRTGYGTWRRIGPMMPGATPVGTLAGALAITFGQEKADVRRYIEADDERALADWLCSRKPPDNPDNAAFLLVIDQFEELFTFANPDERRRFDRLLAAALKDHDCPLFVLSTVRSDFLDRFQNDLPRLVEVRNGPAKLWTLPQISGEALREAITGPARLAGLDVSEIREAMVAEARDEPGALPLVENALEWLWRQPRAGNRLSGRLFSEQGGLAGILSHSADDLLRDLGEDGRMRALELLFRLVKVDPEGYRHARQRTPFTEAVAIAGGGESGRALVSRLAGVRPLDVGKATGPVRLITITDEGRWVNLIHETLIRSKGLDAEAKPQPYWPTLWEYIEQHKERAAWRERLRADMQMWLEKEKAPGFQWSHERVRELHTVMQRPGPKFELNPLEQEFLGPTDLDAMLAELDKPETTHKRRLLIGERLALFGDRREGVGLRPDGLPDIDWIDIDGGKVTIELRKDSNDPKSEVVDRPTDTVASFRIARYPVTVAQFQAFLDECHRGGEWRLPSGFPVDPPLSYLPPKPRMHFGNHPVDSVNWYDACAFCHWLGVRLGFEVRLPTEFEWQYAAASGDPAFTYPWGAEWDPATEPWRANTFESDLGRSTAVGMYPAGASPAGLMDMAGTVWEWCLNLFEKPDVTDFSTSDGLRVLRGGSWYSGQDFARSANRGRNYPLNRDNDFGFRVVCSFPSSGH